MRQQFVAAYEHAGDDGEATNCALDAITVAHLAAAFDFDGGPQRRWEQYKSNAVEQFIAAWEMHNAAEEDPAVQDKLNAALDMLTIAHIAAAFEWAGGPLKW